MHAFVVLLNTVSGTSYWCVTTCHDAQATPFLVTATCDVRHSFETACTICTVIDLSVWLWKKATCTCNLELTGLGVYIY